MISDRLEGKVENHRERKNTEDSDCPDLDEVNEMKKLALSGFAVLAVLFALFVAMNAFDRTAWQTTSPETERSALHPEPTPKSSEFSKEILDEHNALRKKYNVPELVWDDELTRSASTWAAKIASAGQRPPQHQESSKIGENIVWASAGMLTPEFIVQRWAREVENYDIKTNTCAAGKICVHFTQAVWRATKKVGCGKATTPDGQLDFVVCNYYPIGNVRGQHPFMKTGKSATDPTPQ